MKVNVRQLGNGGVPIDVQWLPRPKYDYPGSFPQGFEKYIPQLLKTEDYIHLFSGKSDCGYTVDIKEDLKPDLVASAEELPLGNENFEGGFADPPYTEEFAQELYNCEMPKWSKWTKELVRVVKNKGRIGVMHNYVIPRLPNCRYIKLFVIITRIKQYPKIVTIQKKG